MSKKPPKAKRAKKDRKQSSAVDPIDPLQVIDDVANGVRNVNDLSDDERDSILATRQDSNMTPDLSHKRQVVKLWVAQHAKIYARETSATATMFEVVAFTTASLRKAHLSATGYKLTDDYKDKLAFQDLFMKHSSMIHRIPDLNKINEFKFFTLTYQRQTLRDWINEVVPGHLKSGRPRKE